MRYYSTKKHFVATDKTTGYDIVAVTHLLDKKYLGKFARMPYARVTFRNDAIGDRCKKVWIKLHVKARTDALSLIPEPNGKMTNE